MPKFKSVIASVIIILAVIFSAAAFSRASLNLFSAPERASPGNWIKEEQIIVTKDQVTLNILNPTWARFTDTNSMDPFIDEQTNAIEIKPESAEMIQVGDIISYRTSIGTIIHRVIEISSDQQGIYYRVQGDNNTISDPLLVRFKDIEGVVVAVIY